MKLVTYVRLADDAATQKVGALTADESQVLDLQRASVRDGSGPSPYFTDMIAFLAGGADARTVAADLLAQSPADCLVGIGDVRLLAPVPRPLTLRDTTCHEMHLVNLNRVARVMKGEDPTTIDPDSLKPGPNWYREPVFYKGNVNAVVGPDAEVTFPEGENFKDYELELAFYICKEGKNISHHEAMDYVGGYTILNDFSARMLQLHEMGADLNLGPGRGKDFAFGMGPCLVTPDAFDYEDAEMTARVNGERRGGGNHGECWHKIPDIIEYISMNTTLYPGDVIGTGTVGTGSGLEIGKPLRVGDVVELEIEGIGTLAHTIVAPKACKYLNVSKSNHRYVCGPVDGTSAFVIDDYPDTWRTMPTSKPILDVWRVDEMPAAASATAAVDKGNLPIEHEPPENSAVSIFRHVPFAFPPGMPKLSQMPAQQREDMLAWANEFHGIIGTKHIPTPEDLEKHPTMHRTETLNLFFCSEGPALTALNDLEDAPLQPGDALAQLGGMHGWSGAGTIAGLLVSADMSTFRQLTTKPTPVLASETKRFKRYVTGTLASDTVERGQSDNIIVDWSPNEAEIFGADGTHIGWAGEMWKTYGPNADLSGSADAITGPMEARPPASGITFRMVDLLPGCTLETDSSLLNYYSVVTGVLEASSGRSTVTVEATGDVVQLKDGGMTLRNPGDDVVRFAHFMIDTV